ncbi:hypothetical protein DFJ73DRAFT_825729 [Zopfochytrium polystomum]|nr:hypothetical protein DFJ73DRAFT_825729 [Zopfochytrium polystomum]
MVRLPLSSLSAAASIRTAASVRVVAPLAPQPSKRSRQRSAVFTSPPIATQGAAAKFLSAKALARLRRYGISPEKYRQSLELDDISLSLATHKNSLIRENTDPSLHLVYASSANMTALDLMLRFRLSLERARSMAESCSPRSPKCSSSRRSRIPALLGDRFWNLFNAVWKSPTARMQLVEQDFESLLMLVLGTPSLAMDIRYRIIRSRMRWLAAAFASRNGCTSRALLPLVTLNRIAHGVRRLYFKSPKRILGFLEDLHQDGLTPNAHTYSILIAAAARNSPQVALDVFALFECSLKCALKLLRAQPERKNERLPSKRIIAEATELAELIRSKSPDLGFLFATAIRYCSRLPHAPKKSTTPVYSPSSDESVSDVNHLIGVFETAIFRRKNLIVEETAPVYRRLSDVAWHSPVLKNSFAALHIYQLAESLGYSKDPNVHASIIFALATGHADGPIERLDAVTGERGEFTEAVLSRLRRQKSKVPREVFCDPNSLLVRAACSISSRASSQSVSPAQFDFLQDIIYKMPQFWSKLLPPQTIDALQMYRFTEQITGYPPQRHTRVAAAAALLWAIPLARARNGEGTWTGEPIQKTGLFVDSLPLLAPKPSLSSRQSGITREFIDWIVDEIGLPHSHSQSSSPPNPWRNTAAVPQQNVDFSREGLLARWRDCANSFDCTPANALLDVGVCTLLSAHQDELLRLSLASGDEWKLISPPPRRLRRGLPWFPSASVVDRAALLSANYGRRDLLDALLPSAASVTELSPETVAAVLDLCGTSAGSAEEPLTGWDFRRGYGIFVRIARWRLPEDIHWRVYEAVLRLCLREQDRARGREVFTMALEAGKGSHPKIQRLGETLLNM